MKKTRYSDEQIVRSLCETDKDTVSELAEHHGVGEAENAPVHKLLKQWLQEWSKETSG